MVHFRPQAREIIVKIVYYGPPLGGKTTNLRTLYQGYPASTRGELVVVPAGGDRTIFFDFLPMDAGMLRGMHLRVQLYTVPGQVHYNATRQVVLRGVDGVVFVADSQRDVLRSSVDSWNNLKENLLLQGLSAAEIPLVLQYNKRDLPNIVDIEELDRAVNEYSSPFYEAVATQGIGVEETLQGVVKLVARSLRERFRIGSDGIPSQPPPPAAVLPPKPQQPVGRQADQVARVFPFAGQGPAREEGARAEGGEADAPARKTKDEETTKKVKVTPVPRLGAHREEEAPPPAPTEEVSGPPVRDAPTPTAMDVAAPEEPREEELSFLPSRDLVPPELSPQLTAEVSETAEEEPEEREDEELALPEEPSPAPPPTAERAPADEPAPATGPVLGDYEGPELHRQPAEPQPPAELQPPAEPPPPEVEEPLPIEDRLELELEFDEEPEGEVSPAAQQPPTFEERLGIEEPPVVEQPPAIQMSLEIEEPSAEQELPVFETTPPAEELPVFETTPPDQVPPVGEEPPAVHVDLTPTEEPSFQESLVDGPTVPAAPTITAAAPLPPEVTPVSPEPPQAADFDPAATLPDLRVHAAALSSAPTSEPLPDLSEPFAAAEPPPLLADAEVFDLGLPEEEALPEVEGDVFAAAPPEEPAEPSEPVLSLEVAASTGDIELQREEDVVTVRRVVPRAIAQYGEVRELELEVPVPTVWVGGRRMTLQLRLTLVPEEEIHGG